MKTYSAEEIIAGLREKDEKVFRFLFDTYFEPMVHFAEYMLADHAEAENIVQDCFLHLWEKKEFPDIADIKSYLLTQVKNACLNELQRLQLEDKHKKWLAEAYMYAELPNVEYDEELVKKVRNKQGLFLPHASWTARNTGKQPRNLAFPSTRSIPTSNGRTKPCGTSWALPCCFS